MSYDDPLSYHRYDKKAPHEKTAEEKRAEDAEFWNNFTKVVFFLFWGGILMAVGGGFLAAAGIIVWFIIKDIRQNRKDKSSPPPAAPHKQWELYTTLPKPQN